MDLILNQLDKDLTFDLRLLRLTETVKEPRGETEDRRRLDGFVKYLVSVASHPIGLRASMSPYNVPQEHMLAYLMDLFGIDERGMSNILLGRDVKSRTKPAGADGSLPARKLHSWRPELRVRLSPPKFFYNQQFYLSNLSVRVYAFREESNSGNENNNRMYDGKSRGVLNRIFERFRIDRNVLIRPINEMKALIQFPSHDKSKGPSTKVAPPINQADALQDDIHLNIRRYYCDPKSLHYIRFEFWFKAGTESHDLVSRYRRFIKRFVYNGFNFQCFNKEKRSVYMNEDYDFYGYINLRTTQIPSYPMKDNYPILSLKDRKVNNCDIRMEIKNRRIREDDERLMRQNPRRNSLQSRQFGQMYLNYHIRLYADCILYQCRDLKLATSSNFLAGHTDQDMGLESLLYLPAYSLINQNRLQSNISQYENQSLRRISMLLLIGKLDTMKIPDDDDECIQRILNIMTAIISISHSDYLTSHRTFDNVTLQEMDPFQDDAGQFAMRLELLVLSRLKGSFLDRRLKRHLMRPVDSSNPTLCLDQLVTFKAIKMFKIAMAYFTKCPKLVRSNNPIIREVSALRLSVRGLLCEIVLSDINKSLSEIMSAYQRASSASAKELWTKLHNQIVHIDRVIRLYWSHKGLSGLIESEKALVNRKFLDVGHSKLKVIIEEKLRNYLM